MSSRVFNRNRFACLCTVFMLPVTAVAATPGLEQMWHIIQQQQKTIEQLQARLGETETVVNEYADSVEATADALEVVASEGARTGAGSKTSVGGYGELHYNNLSDDNADIGGDDDVSRTDFHRFVLYFGHEFNDYIRFFSELELEHSLAGDDAPGEVELEQAWIEYDLNQRHRVRAGLDILPIGIINPLHEPNTFYGVERNRIESEIIPATWWEAGVGAIGELAPGWNYDLVVHSGLVMPVDGGGSTLRPRSGRLKVAEADDQDIALTGRLRFTGIPGLEVGVSGQYQSDITGTDDSIDIDATLFEAHIDYKHESGFGLRALYARWDYGDDPLLDPGTVDADSLDGFYVEPAYRFNLSRRLGDVGIFARYSTWDERNQISGTHRFENFEQFTVGFNWWLHANMAFKFDAQFEDADDPVDRVLDGINVGMGYQF